MENLFLTIVNMSITATWAVLAFSILRLILKKIPKWITCFLWGIVGLRLCLPFSIESVFSLIPSTEVIPSDIASSPNPQIDSGVGVVNDVVNPVISNSFTPDPSYSVNPLQVVIGIASYIWVVGLILMVLYCVVSYIILKKKVSASVLYKDNVFYCDNIDTPFILGVIKPKIYIPSGLSEGNLRFVLEHEKAHLKRKDHIIKPISFLLLSVYWFNPAIWLWYVLLCRDIEVACDEKAIKAYDNENKKLYSNALLNCSTQRQIIMACPVAFGEVGVKNRVKSVLNYKKPAFWFVCVVSVLSIVLIGFFATNPKNSDFKNIIEQKGYEIISIKPTTISTEFFGTSILERLEKKPYPFFENKNMTIYLKNAELTWDEKNLNLTFSIEYNDLSDWGVIYSTYYKNEKDKYSYLINLGDTVEFSSFSGEFDTFKGEVISVGPNSEFVVEVNKDLIENTELKKVNASLTLGEITYKSEQSKIEDELAVFLDTQLAELFDSKKDDKNFNCIDYKILGEDKKGADTTLYMTVFWQEYNFTEEAGLILKRELHYPVSLTYQNAGNMFDKNSKSFDLVKCWVPENKHYDNGTDFSENFPKELYNEFKENQAYYYNYQKNSCEASAKNSFNVDEFSENDSKLGFDINDRFSFNEEYNIFNPEYTVAIKVSSMHGFFSEYQKVITDPKVIAKIYDIVDKGINYTNSVKVTREEAGDLNGLTIVLEDYRVYNSTPLSYTYDKHLFISPYFLTPDGCYKLESNVAQELLDLITNAKNDDTIDLTPLIDQNDIIKRYDMNEYEVELPSSWSYNKNDDMFINEEKKLTLSVQRQFYEFSDFYEMQKDAYNNALKLYGSKNVTWSENFDMTEDGISNQCFYSIKDTKGLTVNRFFVYDNAVFLVKVTDTSYSPEYNMCMDLCNWVFFVGKNVYGGSVHLNKKSEETTEIVNEPALPPSSTTPYVDYFTSDGKHIKEWYENGELTTTILSE